MLYIYAGKTALGKEAALKYRHILNIKTDEPIFPCEPDQRVRV